MPQMAPLSWLTLFIYFIFVFMLFNIKNYYNFIYTPPMKSLKSKKSIIKFSWKW